MDSRQSIHLGQECNVNLILIEPRQHNHFEYVMSDPLMLLCLVVLLCVMFGKAIKRRSKRMQYSIRELVLLLVILSGLVASACYHLESHRLRKMSLRPDRAMPEKPYYLGESEITEAQFTAIMRTTSPSGRGQLFPVTSISRKEAEEFCRRLSIISERHVRLPSLSEWQYACGRMTAEGTDWNSPNSRGHIHPVCQKVANEFGLYDMLGNASEWIECSEGNTDIACGGNFDTIAHAGPVYAGMPYPHIGFRIAVDVPDHRDEPPPNQQPPSTAP